MRPFVFALALSVSTSASASPSCSSAPECLQQLKIPHPGAVVLAKIGAALAPLVIGVGAIVTYAVERSRPKAEPAGVVVTTDDDGVTHLELVPAPTDRYLNKTLSNTPPSGAFRFNDVGSHVALAVGSAALVAGVIAGIVGNKSHH